MVKNLPALWETWIQSLDWKDPLEKGMATRSSILSWRTPWIEEPGGLQTMGSQRVQWLNNNILKTLKHSADPLKCSQYYYSGSG